MTRKLICNQDYKWEAWNSSEKKQHILHKSVFKCLPFTINFYPLEIQSKIACELNFTARVDVKAP